MRSLCSLLFILSIQLACIASLGHATYDSFDHARYLSSRPPGAPLEFDCAARSLAFQYGLHIQPWLSPQQKIDLFEALELGSLCGHPTPRVTSSPSPGTHRHSPPRAPTNSTFFVDPVHGSDTFSGSIEHPFRTISHGLSVVRNIVGPKALHLRNGTFYLPEPLSIEKAHSHLTLAAYENESVEISGGIPLDELHWEPHNVSKKGKWISYQGANNVYGRVPTPGSNTSTIRFLGNVSSSKECLDRCKSFSQGSPVHTQCYAFSFYTDHMNSSFANGCYGDITQTWGPTPQDGVVSGRFFQSNVYVADLSTHYPNVASIPGLQRVGGQGRYIRARYPSANPETTLFPNGYIMATQAWKPPLHYPNATTLLLETPERTSWNMFQRYTKGIGGPCSIFTPPESYWCSSHCNGGGARTFRTPSGLTYLNGTFLGLTNFTNPKDAVAHVWRPAHWSSWMYQVDTIDSHSRTITWTKGGFQGARGQDKGAEWYLENLPELLDGPNEFYFDESSSKLYFFANHSSPPPKEGFVATNLDTLIFVRGTQQSPVVNVTIQGIHFTGTRYTYLDPHGVPSGGDWGMQRMAALFMEGTEGSVVKDCEFSRLDGNALMLSGYHRYAEISRNEFSWTGDSCIVLWGRTRDVDGTGGEQPRFTTVQGNFFHEMGVWEKQSSPYFQAKSCQNRILRNIMFNGPRALINFNDGFGGANEVAHNLMFNPNRETSDQGPFNSWDRQPFLTRVRTGEPSLRPAFNEIHHNFMLCNYGSDLCIDNDDGSSYYNNHHNFAVYGGHKSDYGGHNKFTYESIDAYANAYSKGRCGIVFNKQLPHFVDGYYDNICIQGQVNSYFVMQCNATGPNDPSALPIMRNNKIYNAYGNASVWCLDGKRAVVPEEQWQALGFDHGTVILPLPSVNEIMQWARGLLWK